MSSPHPYMEPNPFIPPAPASQSWTRFVYHFEPAEFTGWIDESESWKNTAYVGDWSALTNKIVVKGPDALRFFQDISVNSYAKFAIGQAKHCVQCAPDGNVMCEGVLMRLAEDEYKFTSGPIFWAEYQFDKGDYDATFEQRGKQDFIIQVQGPNALHILEKASGERHRDYGFMRMRRTRIAGQNVWSLRQGMSGEIGFELHGDGATAIAVHEALLEAGEEFGVRRLGGRTKMVNHVEACFPTPLVDYMPAYESDPGFVDFLAHRHPEMLQLQQYPSSGSHVIEKPADRYFDPTELGWGKSIRFDHDFVGRKALEPVVANPKRKMVTLVWNKQDVKDVYASLFDEGTPYAVMELPRNLFDGFAIDRVMQGDRQVGVSTSRCYSYHFRDMLSLCSIDVGVQEGEDVEVIWGNPDQPQKAIRAKVAPAPYKQDKRRVDLTSLPYL